MWIAGRAGTHEPPYKSMLTRTRALAPGGGGGGGRALIANIDAQLAFLRIISGKALDGFMACPARAALPLGRGREKYPS